MSTVIGGFKRRPPKGIKSRRALKKYESKVFENPKTALFLRGTSTSATVNDAMKDIAQIMRPHTKKLSKKNAFHPFEGREHLEFLGFKNDCSLFCFGSSSKKRPENLVLGRHFDFGVLDMLEVGIKAADGIDTEAIKGESACTLGGKPVFFFEGSEWTSDPFFARLQNFIVDYFRGSAESATRLLNIDGIDRAVCVSLRSADESAVVAPPSDCRAGENHGTAAGASSAANAIVRFRHYGVVKPEGGQLSSTAQIKLVDVGPNFDWELRRVFFAAEPDFKRACRLPREAYVYQKGQHQNISQDELGNLKGQLHVGKQDVKSLALRRFKAHSATRRAPRGGKGGDDDDGEAVNESPVAAVEEEKGGSRRAAKATKRLAATEAIVESAGAGGEEGAERKRRRKSSGVKVGAPGVDI